MQHKYCFDAVNRTLNDICGIADSQGFFGNIPILLGGDFAQILPVVPRGNRAATVAASIQNSKLWSQFKVLSLTTNIRVQNGEHNLDFATWLAKMSYEPSMYGLVPLPNYIKSVTSITELIDFVYPNAIVRIAVQNYTVCGDCCILVFRNYTIAEFNDRVLQSLSGTLHTLHSIDSADVNDQNPDFAELPAEYL